MKTDPELVIRYKTEYKHDPKAMTLLATTTAGETVTLRPLQATVDQLEDRDLVLLTEWRNRNRRFFLTDFEATLEGTRRWVTEVTGPDPTRILFMVDCADGTTIGHVGLCNIRLADRYAELDNIVRGGDGPPGAMSASVRALTEWARSRLGIEQLWVRVMADNPAVAFYALLGFRRVKDVPLEYRQDGSKGIWMERAESAAAASRYLRYMEQAA